MQQVHSYTPAPIAATTVGSSSFTPAPLTQQQQQMQMQQVVPVTATTQQVVQQQLPTQQLAQRAPLQAVAQRVLAQPKPIRQASQQQHLQQGEPQGVPQEVLQQVQQHVQQQVLSARAAPQVGPVTFPRKVPLAHQELSRPGVQEPYYSELPMQLPMEARVLQPSVGMQDQHAYAQPLLVQDPVSNRATARDTSVAFMPFFAIRDMDNFLDVCNQCIEVVKNETLCLGYGFAISSDTQNSMAFCREAFANADGVIAHLHNIEFLFKEGLCRYGELVSLQVHGPKAELERLKQDPMIQEMNPEFFELLPTSFEVIEIPMQHMEYYPQDVVMGQEAAMLEQRHAMLGLGSHTTERMNPLVIEAATIGDQIPAVVQARILGSAPVGEPVRLQDAQGVLSERSAMQVPRRTHGTGQSMVAQPMPPQPMAI